MNKIVSLCITILVFANILKAQSQVNIVNNNNEFAFELFGKLNLKDTTNVFISPISISTALSMAYDGAKGKTAKEMRTMLKFSKDQEESHKEFVELLNYYRNSKQNFFTIVNSAVAQEKYGFKDTYLQLLDDYAAVIHSADFRNESSREKARIEMNNWVSENTEKKIKDLIDKNSLDELTRLVLINAIYFKADWQYEFPIDKTRQMIFYKKTRQYITSFMHNRQNYNFFKNEDLLMIELPYKDSSASMYIILPKEGADIDQFCAEMTYDKFNNLEKQCSSKLIDLLLPKFKIDAKYKLKEQLREMGMLEAFTGRANFNKMNGRSDLMIDEVIHQSFIEIDEKGTEAAAATAVVVREKSAPQVEYININRPFFFLIKEHKKGSILFIGKFTKP